jgi:uncharacterized protein
VEIETTLLPRLIEIREAVVDALKKTGFNYVSLDLEGFRSGSMNEVIQTVGRQEI